MRALFRSIKSLILAVALFLGVGSGAFTQEDMAVGQVWKATDMWIVIGKIDYFDRLTVVSVSAYEDEGLAVQMAAHLPLSLETFNKSVIALKRRDAPVAQDFLGGYNTWRAAFDAGKAGVW